MGCYRLSTADRPSRKLGDGFASDYPTMAQAAVAFTNSRAPYKQVVYDDGHTVRFLDEDEERLLETVAGRLGYKLEETGGEELE